MKKLLLIAGLTCGLAGLTASAQMAPSPNDPHQQPGVSVPGTPPTFPSDRQETDKDRQNRTDTNADKQQTDKDSQDQRDRDRQSNDRNEPAQRTDRDDQTTSPKTDRDYDRDRNNGSVGSNAGQDRDHDKDRDHHSEYQSQLQNAFQQQPNLAGVQANFTDTTVELTGTVPTGKEKHEARMLAQSYANGRKVVDHITVSGKGH